MKKIGSGAEAVVYKDKNQVIKIRPKKGYRISEIDSELRKFRTRREAKVIEKLPVPGPKLIDCDRKEKLVMSYIKGNKVRDILDNQPKLARDIGHKLSLMHDADIIHGDLTTSNMIFDKELKFIDFGLSFFSSRIEDKAVDIHLFKQALESKHFRIEKTAYKEFLKGYKRARDYELIISRLEEVEGRGRYKGK